MSEITNFEGDMFWDEADTEDSVEPDDAMDNVMTGEIIEFEQAKRLPNFFGVHMPEGQEHRYFTSQEEAEAFARELNNK